MAMDVVIAHRIPGRARLLIRKKRGDQEYFSRLSEKFSRIDEVHSVKANPLTGSIVLEFAGVLEEILKAARVPELFENDEELNLGHHHAGTFSPLHLVSGREINPMFMTGIAFLMIGMIQTFRGQWFPPALSVFWRATQAFRAARNHS